MNALYRHSSLYRSAQRCLQQCTVIKPLPRAPCLCRLAFSSPKTLESRLQRLHSQTPSTAPRMSSFLRRTVRDPCKLCTTHSRYNARAIDRYLFLVLHISCLDRKTSFHVHVYLSTSRCVLAQLSVELQIARTRQADAKKHVAHTPSIAACKPPSSMILSPGKRGLNAGQITKQRHQ